MSTIEKNNWGIWAAAALVVCLCACSRTGYQRTQGELVGASKKKGWSRKKPRGMSLIPAGSFTMGNSSYDPIHPLRTSAKTASVNGFYMDETEITNREYHQFVNWVRDSIVRTWLAERAGSPEAGKADGLAAYAYRKPPYESDEKMLATNTQRRADSGPDAEKTQKQLDWSSDIIWDRKSYPSKAYAAALEQIYLPAGERMGGEPVIDVRKLNYRYRELDSNAAPKEGENREANFIEKVINVYPDTAVWTKDFHFSHNEPLQMQYFSHESYSEYPVVGVSWYQANAFCVWRTDYKNRYQKSRGKPAVFPFRLPTETEWEYAARGGIDNETYPWGGPYLMDERGRFLANFKPRRGDYLADGAMYTAQVKSYYPNGYGLYNMAGNVAEWTSSSYNSASYRAYSALNPTLKGQGESNPKKVIRGGSWKDVGYYLKVSTRDFEYADSARSYIGFRTVQDYPNRPKMRRY